MKYDEGHFFNKWQPLLLPHECQGINKKIQRSWTEVYIVSNGSILDEKGIEDIQMCRINHRKLILYPNIWMLTAFNCITEICTCHCANSYWAPNHPTRIQSWNTLSKS